MKLKHGKIIFIFTASNISLPDTSGRKELITLARRTQRKITNSESYEYWEDGVQHKKQIHRVFTIGSEGDFVKFYVRGLLYIRDMPTDCLQLLLLLLPFLRYAEPPCSHMFDYSLTVTVDSTLRAYLLQEMGYDKPGSISNILTKLVDGRVLFRAAKGLYRVNPHLIGRGDPKDMGEARSRCDQPLQDATFMSVYKEAKLKKGLKKIGIDIELTKKENDPLLP